MREILFKAKGTTTGKWYEGFLVALNEDCCHIKDDKGAVYYCNINTICQYTGLTDKNGNKIWENDVVEFEDVGEDGYEYKEGFEFNNRAKVVFEEARWSLTQFAEINSGVVDEMYNHAEFMEFWQYCEVVGNLFDNPELLGV